MYVYAYFCHDVCPYVGKGSGYRATNHLKYHKEEKKGAKESWKTYIRKARTAVSAINRAWLLGKPLTLFVNFVRQHLDREVEASLITKLKPSANMVKCNHRDGKEIAKHFKNPKFGSNLFCKLTNNDLIVI